MHNSNDQGNTSNRNIQTSNMCEMGREYRLNQRTNSHIHDHISQNIEQSTNCRKQEWKVAWKDHIFKNQQ